MKNKRVKQMICDVLMQDRNVEKAFFSNKYPMLAIGKKNGKIQFLSLKVILIGYRGIRFEEIKDYEKPISLTVNQLKNKG